MSEIPDSEYCDESFSVMRERLSLLMAERQLTKKDLSEMIGRAPSTVGNLLKGSAPSLAIVLDIAKALDVSLDWLVGRSEVMRPNYLLVGHFGLSTTALDNINMHGRLAEEAKTDAKEVRFPPGTVEYHIVHNVIDTSQRFDVLAKYAPEYAQEVVLSDEGSELFSEYQNDPVLFEKDLFSHIGPVRQSVAEVLALDHIICDWKLIELLGMYLNSFEPQDYGRLYRPDHIPVVVESMIIDEIRHLRRELSENPELNMKIYSSEDIMNVTTQFSMWVSHIVNWRYLHEGNLPPELDPSVLDVACVRSIMDLHSWKYDNDR